MSGMTSRRRSILAIVPLVAAACGSTPLASADLSTAPSTNPPASSASSPTAGPSIPPTLADSCDGLPADYAPPTITFEPHIGHLSLTFGAERVVPHEFPDATFAFDPVVYDQEVRDVPAGFDVPMAVSLFYSGVNRDAMAPIELVSLSITVEIEGLPSVPLTLETDRRGVDWWDAVASGVPDLDGTASVEFAAEWTDRCFNYSGHARLEGVSLFSTTRTAGCRISPDQDVFWDELNDTFGDPIFVDGQPVDVFWQKAEARYVPVGGPGGDSAPAYASWDRAAAPVVADPSAVLAVAQSTPAFELPTMVSYFFDRADIIAALEVLGQTYPPPNPDFVSRREPARQPDGSFNLRVPKSPGRYMAWLDFTFSSRCATGRAWSVFSVTVRDPDL